VRLDLSLCTIRDWDARDAPALARHANDRSVWRNLRDAFPHPYTLADAERWIRAATGAQPVTNFAIAVRDEAAGGIGIILGQDVYARTAELGYWLGQPFWGRGIMTEAVGAFTEYAFAHFALHRIAARVFEWNPASARVLEKCGYRLEGRCRRAVTKDGRTMDELLYAVLSPSPPCPTRDQAPLPPAPPGIRGQ
jgi:RimJ/RimL family protein N-acetyltransferase